MSDIVNNVKRRSGWCKSRDLVPLLASRGLRAKDRLHSACVRSAMLHGSGKWPIKEVDVIRLDRNDNMVRWMCNVRAEDRIPAEEITTRLKLKGTRDCLQDRRLQQFGHLERMEASACLVNVELTRLVEVSAEENQGHGMK